MDDRTKQQRSYCMSRIKGKNTIPEMVFRKYIWSKGIKDYRLHSKIRGKPDLYFPTKKIALFIDGCFWHQCPKCYRPPKTNKKYWSEKIKDNVERDLKTDIYLENNGIHVLRLWEHDIKANINKSFKKIKKYYDKYGEIKK